MGTSDGSRTLGAKQELSNDIVASTSTDGNLGAATGLDHLGDDRKGLARLKACAAIAGVQVHDLADGGLLVCRWGLSRAVPDVRALALFLAQLGVHV